MGIRVRSRDTFPRFCHIVALRRCGKIPTGRRASDMVDCFPNGVTVHHSDWRKIRQLPPWLCAPSMALGPETNKGLCSDQHAASTVGEKTGVTLASGFPPPTRTTKKNEFGASSAAPKNTCQNLTSLSALSRYLAFAFSTQTHLLRGNKQLLAPAQTTC